MTSESAVRSREEDEELQRSLKKVKENLRDKSSTEPLTPDSRGVGGSYKAKLLGLIPGAYEQAFAFNSNVESEVESDDEEEDLPPREVVVRLSGARKSTIRATWNNAFIVKVFGKTIGYHYLVSHLTSLWKPVGKMDCVGLGHDFFLIKFSQMEGHSRVLKNGPWFVSGHYLSVRRWEPNFIPSSANLSMVAVWIRLPELPIEYYEDSVLRDIGRAIGLVLKVDNHVAMEARAVCATLCPSKS